MLRWSGSLVNGLTNRGTVQYCMWYYIGRVSPQQVS